MIEEAVYNDEGQLMTGSFMDYALPRATDFPQFEMHNTVTPTPVNPLGAKGCGEAGAIGAPAAVISAALDALAPLGVTDLDMPLTSEQVWRRIRQALQKSP
jgi:carbon-monoxide dehydrogenase large subunit